MNKETLELRKSQFEAYRRAECDTVRITVPEILELIELAEIGLRWRTDSALEKWFPISAEEHKRLLKAVGDLCGHLPGVSNEEMLADFKHAHIGLMAQNRELYSKFDAMHTRAMKAEAERDAATKGGSHD